MFLINYLKRYTIKGIIFKFKELILFFLTKIGIYSFQFAKTEWKRLPFDNFGYFKANEILNYSDNKLIEFVKSFEEQRYNKNNWRNYNNLWRENLGLDSTSDKIIFDYGCGFGIESLQFAKNNNSIILGDINNESLNIASKILNTYNFEPIDKVLINNRYPFFDLTTKIDIFYSNGVLHHTPYIKEILTNAIQVMKPNGEIRLLLYTDKMWTGLTDTPPPPNDYHIQNHEKYWLFLRGADLVGQYADFYSEEKLKHQLGNNFKIKEFSYICGPRINNKNGNNLEGCYCTVIIKPKC